jgi:CheY-like chemotaxis protein
MDHLRVLHVDDDPDIRTIVEISLGLDASIELKSCASAEDALAEAACWPPDLVLLDVMMPRMDGPTMLARLRANGDTAAIPVIFMTASAKPKDVAYFRSLGADGVLIKPFDAMTLAKSVRAVFAAIPPRG